MITRLLTLYEGVLKIFFFLYPIRYSHYRPGWDGLSDAAGPAAPNCIVVRRVRLAVGIDDSGVTGDSSGTDVGVGDSGDSCGGRSSSISGGGCSSGRRRSSDGGGGGRNRTS